MPAGLFKSRAFRQSRPILLTTFTNRVGNIGLSLIPILLVERRVSTAQGAFVLAALKAAILAGTLGGGALSDRFGPRGLVLAALVLSAAGLGGLPFQRAALPILAFGVLGTVAESLINVAQRLLLMNEVDAGHQKEALGWMRMVNNFAQIFSYAIAAAAARLGVAPLMLFDASTSALAFLVGRKILPAASSSAGPGRGLAGGAKKEWASKSAFFGCALALMGWALFYELFLEGGAGRLEVLHPGEGLRRFSTLMILNTVLCAIFSVQATRLLRESLSAMLGGLLLTASGLLVASWGMASQAWVFAGMLLLTLGELMMGAVGQYTLMRLTPESENAGFYYSLGLTLMQCGRIAGAALAFPLLIRADGLRRVTTLVLSALLALLGVLYSQRGKIARQV